MHLKFNCAVFALLAGSNSVAGQASSHTVSFPRYDIDVAMADTAAPIAVRARVSLEQLPLSPKVTLLVSALFRDVTASLITAAGDTTILAVTAGDTTSGQVAWTMILPAPQPTATLLLRYRGGIGSQTVYSMQGGTGFAGSNTAWYPQLPAYRGTRALGTGAIRFQVPAGFTVVSTGRLQQPGESAHGAFHYMVDRAASFSFAVARYTRYHHPGVALYTFTPGVRAESIATRLGTVTEVLVKAFGPLPFGDFALVEVRDGQAARAGFNGASAAGFIMSDETGIAAPFNLAYYGHEVGHQWWGNAVTVEGQRGLYMLSEAMAQYGSLQVVEALAGQTAGERYRRDGFPGYNSAQNARGYLRLAEAGLDEPLAGLHGAQAHALANAKGFLVFDMVSRLVGKERFHAMLRAFITSHANTPATWSDFENAVSVLAAPRMRSFLGDWTERMGAPDVVTSWRQETSHLLVRMTQSAPAFLVRVPLVVSSHVNRIARDSTVVIVTRSLDTTVDVTIRGKVDSVSLDPHYELLRWTPDLRGDAVALRSFTRGVALEGAGKQADARAAYVAGLDSISVPDTYGARFVLEYALGGLALSARQYAEAREHLTSALASAVRSPQRLASAYLRLAQASKALGDDASARTAASDALTADALVGGTWITASARAYLRGDPNRALSLRVDSVVRSTMQQRAIPGAAVVVLQKGNTLVQRGYGVESIQRRDSVTPDTRFQIGSMTKPFTATLVMQLMHDKKLRFADRARTYLAWLPVAYDSVTIRDLLSHTAGVPRDLRTSNTDDMSPAQFRERLLASSPAFPRATRFEYANTGFILLGMIIEAVTGRSYADELRDRVLAPAGMTGTTYLERLPDRTRIARGHEPIDGVQQPALYFSGGFAAGGLTSTAADVARFVLALDRGVLLSRAEQDTMTTPAHLGDGTPVIAFGDSTRSYGLGWEITTWRGQRVVTHGGAVSGFSAILNRFADGTTIIVLCNSKVGADRRGDADALARAVAGVVIQ